MGVHLVFWGVIPNPIYDDGKWTLAATDRSLSLVNHQIRFGDRILNDPDDPDEPNAFNSPSENTRLTGYVPLDHRGLRWIRDCGLNTPGQNARGVPDLGIIDGFNDVEELPDETPHKIGFTRGQDCWPAMQDVTAHDAHDDFPGAPDYELEPYDGEFGAYAKLNTYQHQGSLNPDQLIWHDGHGLDNAKIKYRPGGTAITHPHVLGKGEGAVPSVTVADVESSADIGVYTKWIPVEYRAGAVDVLKAVAQRIAAAYGSPPDYFDITPDLSTYGYFRITLTTLHYPEKTTEPTRDAIPSRVIARLENVTDADVTIPINGSRDAKVVVDHQHLRDQGVNLIKPYATMLKIRYITPDDDPTNPYYGDDFLVGDACRASLKDGDLIRRMTGSITQVRLRKNDDAGNVVQEVEAKPDVAVELDAVEGDAGAGGT